MKTKEMAQAKLEANDCPAGNEENEIPCLVKMIDEACRELVAAAETLEGRLNSILGEVDKLEIKDVPVKSTVTGLGSRLAANLRLIEFARLRVARLANRIQL